MGKIGEMSGLAVGYWPLAIGKCRFLKTRDNLKGLPYKLPIRFHVMSTR